MNKNKFKRYLRMAKTGELFYKIRQKISVCFVKNKITKNDILEYKEYRRLKRKYGKYIENKIPNKNMKESKYVWIFWYQGLEKAPDLVKECIKTTKRTFKDKEVVILTKDNYEKYVKFPDYIIKKFKKGIITFTHFSDLLRVELLSMYGGIWCDATLYFTDNVPDYVTKADLFVFKNINLDRTDNTPIVASNWFIACKKGNSIITATRDLLFEYYKRERFIKNYFFFHLFFTIVTEKYANEWKRVPTFNNVNPHILQFELLNDYDRERFEQIKKMSFVHKLNKVLVNNNKKKYTFYDYIINRRK